MSRKKFPIPMLAIGVCVALGPAAAGGISREELPTDLRAALDKTLQAYRGAKTYQDDGRVQIHMGAQQTGGAPSLPSVLRFERPNKVSFDLDVMSIRSDGAKMVRFSRRTGQAFGAPAPAVMTPEAVVTLAPGQPDLFVHLKLLMGEDPLSGLLDDATTVALEPDAMVDEQPCYVVRFGQPDDQMDARMYIDKQTHLLREFRLSAAGKEDKLPPGMPERISLQLRNPRIDEPIPAEVFSVPLAAAPDQNASGTPAPLFELQDLDGNNFKLIDLRGKVVVLDFWATWCKPCIDEMPFLQRAYVAYKGKPVAFVGICTDVGAPAGKIRKFLNRLGVTFPTLLDSTGTVQQLYDVRGLPTTVLIDKQGVVRAVHAGFSTFGRSNPVDALTKKIDELLEK